ncbi:anti-sigma factor family protein [Paraburkholderia sp. J12]|uniref:anti-sigma factor family protein n=1 Tax=Paraburkholderia sp. J12 TaxID=2805432 RepID=UPI002ABE8269|nr:zf-HC2 domain-containing protein [Paraburkholderia sp. J12]
MNCDEARPLIDASVDRELSAGDEWRLQRHLAECALCQCEVEAVRAIAMAVRSVPYSRAPAGLGARIAAALPPTVPDATEAHHESMDAERAHPRKSGAGRSQWLRFPGFGGAGSGKGGMGGIGGTGSGGTSMGFGWLAGVVLVLCALGFVAALNLHRPAEGGTFVDEIVASHVRAQISGRDIDVISTDRHTVKPWFNGKIDYAPPVEDLASAGYALVGGRLDYVGRERVAVLVYRYRKHVIDLYVFPAGDGQSGADTQAPPRTSDGYAVARWQAAGMTWWAVSDAEPDALAGLRAALDQRLAGGSSEG